FSFSRASHHPPSHPRDTPEIQNGRDHRDKRPSPRPEDASEAQQIPTLGDLERSSAPEEWNAREIPPHAPRRRDPRRRYNMPPEGYYPAPMYPPMGYPMQYPHYPPGMYDYGGGGGGLPFEERGRHFGERRDHR